MRYRWIMKYDWVILSCWSMVNNRHLWLTSISSVRQPRVTLIQCNNYTWQNKQSVSKRTLALYFLAMLFASVVFPDRGGPTTHSLQGDLGCGSIRYGLGFLKNFISASLVDNTYILSRKLKEREKEVAVSFTILIFRPFSY